MSDPRLTALAASLPATVPFVGPEAIERQTGKAFRARLGANESIFGPSPKAVEAMQRAASEAWKYPDPESHELRFALADHLDVAVEEIVVGAGIDGLLGSLVRLFVAPGDVVVTSRGPIRRSTTTSPVTAGICTFAIIAMTTKTPMPLSTKRSRRRRNCSI